ncbi:hypothetical protein NKR23_g11589 [Pleurostoma richardsiae]|uniref:N-acetyltransferase domain-containing protein n=1 Tax=Pleurostoma richardsiae TaxID=41990 RepID=A0AA38R7J2_9PEZI|nr:hypothetical protein NKR23_g11589 [Pleurostoma richardsiae]
MSSAFELRTAREDDIPAMAQVEVEAFKDHHATKALFPERLRTKPGQEDQYNWRLAILKQGLEKPNRHWIVAVGGGGLVANDEGDPMRVVGYAQWMMPGDPVHDMTAKERVEDLERSTGNYPTSIDREALHAVASGAEELNKNAEEALGDLKELWSLNSIAVSPSYQRRGVGRMLLHWGLERAEQDGKDVYLLASPSGRFLYSSVGFEEVAQGNIVGGREVVMVKRAPLPG